MVDQVASTGESIESTLDLAAYRSKNQDLQQLSDEELVEHFMSYGRNERRPFAYTKRTIDRLSMKYLRGDGMEIGAGSDPAPLFGNASCVYTDITEDTVYDSIAGNKQILFDINHPTELPQKFDFVIACHILEHVDSLAVGLSAISRTLKPDGIAYIVLPNVERDADQFWMPRFGRIHHLVEKFWPTAFRARHERDFCRGINRSLSPNWSGPVQQRFSEELKQDLLQGRVTPDYRYIYHRHSYSFRDWTDILLFLTKLTIPRLTLIDAAAGEERSDCHFVFVRDS